MSRSWLASSLRDFRVDRGSSGESSLPLGIKRVYLSNLERLGQSSPAKHFITVALESDGQLWATRCHDSPVTDDVDHGGSQFEQKATKVGNRQDTTVPLGGGIKES